MKRSIAAVAIFLGWACAAWSAAPAPVTTLRAIHALTNAEASHALPVAFEATVIYYRSRLGWLFVEDDNVAIFVRPPASYDLVPGDRVLVNGTTHDSFRTFITGSNVTLLHHGELPKPAPATFDELIRGEHDAQLVTVRAEIRAVNPGFSGGDGAVHSTTLQLLTDGGIIDATVDGDHAEELKDLLDAEVEVTGVMSGEWDGKMQLIGIVLHLSSRSEIKVLKKASVSPWSIPPTPMDVVLTNYHVHNLSQRVRVQGTITYYEPGSAMVLQSGEKSLWIDTMATAPMRIGDLADVTGFPEVQGGSLILTDAEVKDSLMQAPIQPVPATWLQLASRGSDVRNHIFDLVSIEGQVVAEVREASQDEYVVVSDGQLITAIYNHAEISRPGQFPPMNAIAPGSRVRLTGICIPEKSNPLGVQAFRSQEPFNILLRSPSDIAVVAKPSLLSIRNLILLVGMLLLVVFIVSARGWAIERRVRRHTAALASIEKRRSRILEDISGTRALSEIVEQIAELVSFKLRGAPCWCQIADGALLGNCPPKLTGLRVVRSEIPARTGPALGTVFAAFDQLAQPSADEQDALSMAVGLTALAIETRRLYSDLLRRSEFDLLTDIHNRFSLEKYLEEQIAKARQNAGIFGLIYIDLDGFKQVNDRYGHLIGDQYLQQVTLRMKHQLRSVDMLARLGGDEFAALVPVVRNRSKVEEIAQRLKRSFDAPFTVGEYILKGSASVGIALYPEDASTADGLLSAADSAMYLAKHSKLELATERWTR